jgi:hypothetical protein
LEEENILDEEVLELYGKKRPTAITVLCIFEFISAAGGIIFIFSGYASKIARWYPPLMGLSTVNLIICMIGIWQMKRWAVYLYVCFFVFMQMIMISMGVWNILSFIVPMVVLSILFNFFKKMN